MQLKRTQGINMQVDTYSEEWGCNWREHRELTCKSILIVKIENVTEENREHESQFQHDRQLFISLLLTNARKYVVPEKR